MVSETLLGPLAVTRQKHTVAACRRWNTLPLARWPGSKDRQKEEHVPVMHTQRPHIHPLGSTYSLLPTSQKRHLLEITALRHRLSEPFKVCKDTEQSLGDPSPHDFFLQDSDYKVRRFHQHGKQQSCRMCWTECGCRPQAGPITLVCVRK